MPREVTPYHDAYGYVPRNNLFATFSSHHDHDISVFFVSLLGSSEPADLG